MKKESTNHPKPSKKASASSMRLALENRLLFDGAVVATAVQVMDDKAGQDQAHDAGKDAKTDVAPPDASVDSADSPAAQGGLIEGKDFAPQPQAITAAASAGNPDAPTLLVIDPRTEGSGELLKNPPPNTDTRVLDESRDGYQQIAEILQERDNTTQLHLLTSDINGQQWLGASQINPSLTASNTEALTDWGDSLASNASIVVHGREAMNNSWLDHVDALTGGQATWSQDRNFEGNNTATNDTATNAQARDSDNLTDVISTDAATQPTALVFIDTNVSDYQTLLDGIDPSATVVLLDPAKDGVEQIAQTVSRYTNVDAVHIISHGDDGRINLGSAILDQASMQGKYADEFATINAALSENADILVYGCDVAAGAQGQAFVSALADATGADIAASTNDTGAAALGGDWVLEEKTGQIESRIIINGEAQDQYANVLRSPNAPLSGLTNAPTSNYSGTLANTFNINGTSGITSDVVGGQQVIQLTKPTNSQSGSAWSNYQIDLTKNFTIDFDVYLGTNDASGADGIAFALQNSGPTVTGAAGGAIGVGNIPNSVAIEFDTWRNTDANLRPLPDIVNDHIAIYRPATRTYAGQALGAGINRDVGNIEDGRWYNTVVTWNASSKTLSYTFAGPAGSAAGGASGIVTDSAVIDPATVFGDNSVYFGWAASTGASINDQRVAINSISNLSPAVDLNGPAPGTDYATTFTENGAGVSIAAPTSTVADADNANMVSATITLSDKQALDQLLVGGSSAQSGTINGINYTLVDDGTSISIKLEGSASKAAYAATIQAITFSNSSENPSSADRLISVKVNDGISDSDPAVTTIKVIPVNDAPAGADKTIGIDEDTPYTVTANDFGFTDPIDTPSNTFANVVVTSLPPAAQGVYKLNGIAVTANQVLSVAEINAGLLTFSPAANASGVALGVLGFKVRDNGGTANGGIDTDPTANTLTFNVATVNDPPVAIPVSRSGNEDTPIPVSLIGTDVDGTIANVSITTLPNTSQGILYLPDGITPVTAGKALTPAEAAGLIFKPAPDFNGSVVIPFTVTDNNGAISVPANATLTVTPSNDPPIATPVSPSGAEDMPVPVSLAGTDVDGTVASVTVTALPPATEGILYLPNGTPVVAGRPLTPADAAGLIFKPAPNFNGPVTIPFTVTDNNGAISAPTNANITITPDNDPPVAVSGSTNTPEDTNAPVNLTGTDVDDTVSSVTVTALPPAAQGVLTKADGSPVLAGVPLTPSEAAGLIFNPAPNFNGIVTIPFTVTDNNGATSAPASFVIDVKDVNDDPVATPATVNGTEDTPVPVKLTGIDAEGLIKAVTVTTLPPASQGILTKANGTPVVAGVPLTPNEAAGLIFTPAPNFSGKVTVPFTVTDSVGQVSSPPAELTINIAEVNDPPVAIPASSDGNEDKPIPVSLVGTDVDGTVTAVTVTTLPPATQGILYLPDGKTPVIAGVPLSPADAAAGLIFKPAPNFNGTVAIPFTVTDNNGAVSPPANANITVAPVNDPPVAISGSVNTPEDTDAPVSLVGTDVDGTVNTVTVASLPSPAQGILYLADGATPVLAGVPLTPNEAAGLIFRPAPNTTGIVTIPFTVTDNNDATSPLGNYVIDVANVDDDPVATPATVNGIEDTPVPVKLTGTDVEGPIASVTVTTLPPASQGILTKADGTPVVAGVPLSATDAAGLVFNPAPNFSGTVTIPFTVTDSVGQVSSPPADLTINIVAVNDPPIANDDGPIATKPNTPARGNVLTGTGGATADVDAEGNPLSVTQFSIPGVGTFTAGKTATIPGVGTLVINKDGSFAFTPIPGYAGPVPAATYTITDGISTDTATLSFAPVPKAPASNGFSNIGPIILLSNPTPPLFPPSTGASYSLLPEDKPELTSANYEFYKPTRPSLYGDLQDYDVYLTGTLRNQVVLELQKYSFSIPPGTFRHTNPNEQLQYKATRADGSPLPDWLKFNAKKLKFSGVPPRGSANVDVMVKALDAYGNEAYATFKVTVNKERIDRDRANLNNKHHAQVSEPINQRAMIAGKLAFNEQLNSVGKLSRLMESRALLDSLNQL